MEAKREDLQVGDDRYLGTADIASASRPAPANLDADVEESRAAEAPDVGRTEAGDQGQVPLLDQDAAASFQGRWDEVQGEFVDEPRSFFQRLLAA